MVIASRVGVLVIGLMAVHAIGYPEGRAPFRVAANEAGNLPARFDAGWYLQTATYGYEYLPNRFDRQQNLVFFPAFPVLMSLASLLVARQTLWAGTLLSMAAFAWAARYLYRLARDLMDADRAQTAVALACLYPFAVFYSAAYTESLFLLAMLGAWYHLRRDERWPAFALGPAGRADAAQRLPAVDPARAAGADAAVARRPAAAAGRRLGEPDRSPGRGGRSRLRHAAVLGLRLRPHRRSVHVDSPPGGLGP